MKKRTSFEWDDENDLKNRKKHGVSFIEAQFAFGDHNRIILRDLDHSDSEDRFYCIGRVENGILTVRFTYRENRIRIFGAGYWRKGKKIYEEQNSKED